MKKIVFSIAIITIMAAVIVGATTAYFSDTESSDDNTFAAGTMDLDLNGQDSGVTMMTLSDKAPGDSGTTTGVTLSNAGSLDGELDTAIGTVNNYPCTDEPNGGKNDGTEYCTSDAGALGAAAEIAPYLDIDESGSWTTDDIGLKSDGNTYVNNSSTSLDYDVVDNYSGVSWDNVYSGVMTAGISDDFIVAWQVPTGAGNTMQGDALDFSITFTLEQIDED